MENTTSLRPGAYLIAWKAFSVLSRPNIQLILDYVERNPGCSAADILNGAQPSSNHSRVSQLLKELRELDVIRVQKNKATLQVFLNTERLQLINNSAARLL